MIEKVQESHLYMWLKEKDSKFLSKLDETIEYANTILPQINNVFASYTVHGVRHSKCDGIYVCTCCGYK